MSGKVSVLSFQFSINSQFPVLKLTVFSREKKLSFAGSSRFRDTPFEDALKDLSPRENGLLACGASGGSLGLLF